MEIIKQLILQTNIYMNTNKKNVNHLLLQDIVNYITYLINIFGLKLPSSSVDDTDSYSLDTDRKPTVKLEYFPTSNVEESQLGKETKEAKKKAAKEKKIRIRKMKKIQVLLMEQHKLMMIDNRHTNFGDFILMFLLFLFFLL